MGKKKPKKKSASGKTRIAMIGAGVQANKVHYPSLASFRDVEIAAVCDLDEERRHTTADKYGVKQRYEDYRRMLDEIQPDGVYAIADPHVIYDVWVDCLKRGENLYIEKPMGITLHQARALQYLAEENGCITQVSFQRRACPMVVKLRKACLKHGPIVHATCRFYKCETTPFLGARDHMMDDCVHSIDTLRWICGGEVVHMESECKRIGTPDINFISASLYFDNEAIGFLVNSWTSGRRIFAVEMHAPGICAEAEHEGQGVLYADGDTTGKRYGTREVAKSDEFFVYGGFQAKNREFIDALQGGPMPKSHFGDAVKTMEVAESILAQATLEDVDW